MTTKGICLKALFVVLRVQGANIDKHSATYTEEV